MQKCVIGQTEPYAKNVDQPGQWRQQRQGDKRGAGIENHPRQRQALAATTGPQKADHGGADAGPDIGSDHDCHGLNQHQMSARHCCQGQNQRRMTGLQHQRCNQACSREQQHACHAGDINTIQAQIAAGAGKPVLDLIDPQENEGDTQQHAPRRFAARAGKSGQHPEYQQRQGQRREAEILTGKSQQPDARDGAEFGAEQDRNTAHQFDQAGADESDRQKRYQGAGLQQRGGADPEQQPPARRAGAARQPLFKLAACQLSQAFFQHLHAEKKQRQARAQLQPGAATPKRPDQPCRNQKTRKISILHHRIFALRPRVRRCPISTPNAPARA